MDEAPKELNTKAYAMTLKEERGSLKSVAR